MKIKYRRVGDKRVVRPLEIIEKGDWVDLAAADRVNLLTGEYVQIPLGIAMELPKGFEAIIASRSSTPRKHGIAIPCGFGVVDNTYCGDNDEWKYIALAFRATEIPINTRIAQFRIQPSQFATPWQKIKWLFTRKIEFVEVEVLGNINRGGIGSTGN